MSSWRENALAREAGWDRRLARIWGALLVVGFLLPLNVLRGPGGTRTWVFVWDAVGEADTLSTVWLFMPLVLGLTATLVAAAASPKLRGTVLLVGALFVSVVPVVVSGPLLFGPFGQTALHLIALWLIILLAPPIIAGGNHVARRSGGDPLSRILIGLGGLALLLALFIPLGPDSESIFSMLFGSGSRLGQMSQMWPLVLWILIVLMYAVVAALFLYPGLNARAFGAWLSMAGRFALYGLPIAIVVMLFVTGSWDDSNFFANLLVLVGGLLRLYGVMILTALGVALILDRTPPASDPGRLVEAF